MVGVATMVVAAGAAVPGAALGVDAWTTVGSVADVDEAMAVGGADVTTSVCGEVVFPFATSWKTSLTV